jgi:type II secretory pathway component PulL
MVYKWSIGIYDKVDANVAGAELEKIEQEHGEVTQQAVVDAARPKKSVLHDLFEWDDKIAGEKWRLNQARCLIAALVVVPDEDKNYDKRAYVNIVKRAEHHQEQARYINYENAMSDQELGQTVLQNAKQELAAFRDKYKSLSELARVFEAIDEVVGKDVA